MNSITKLRHGLYYIAEYKVYHCMKQRCYNTTHRQYVHYGGRGITICDEWLGLDGFENFILDMDWRPSDRHSLDRVNNDGNYEPSNCRWATKSQQQTNRRKSRNNSSGYIGVFYVKDCRDKWESKIMMNGSTIRLGRFSIPELAAIEYDKYVLFYRDRYDTTNIL